jgi:catechol-2,3-dioxygenase
MKVQGVVMNVVDLNRSIDFYREAFGFSLISQDEELAAVSAPGGGAPQVIVLRGFASGRMGGARHSGLRGFVLEVESVGELERIACELGSRNALVSRREHSEWSALVGRDPDGVAVIVALGADREGIAGENWKTLDPFLYGIGE